MYSTCPAWHRISAKEMLTCHYLFLLVELSDDPNYCHFSSLKTIVQQKSETSQVTQLEMSKLRFYSSLSLKPFFLKLFAFTIPSWPLLSGKGRNLCN